MDTIWLMYSCADCKVLFAMLEGVEAVQCCHCTSTNLRDAGYIEVNMDLIRTTPMQ